MHSYRLTTRFVVAAMLLAGAPIVEAAQSDAQSMEELRNTVINLLQGLVDRGVLTREQAEKMVRDAQSKATADAAATAAQEKAEEGAVRVPYVPEVVKEEIRRQVAADLGAQVTKSVMDASQEEGWGTPSALPDWVKRMRWYGDMRLREQGDFFASDNVPNTYLDFQRINEAGGASKAGAGAFVNVEQDRDRLRARLRFGFETVLGYGWNMGARIATGTLRDPISTNQTLGAYGFRHQLGLDLAYIDWSQSSRTGRHNFGFTGGRMRNPFFTPTDLLFDQDLTFDGVASSYRFGLMRNDPSSRFLFANAGVFPLQEFELTGHDKWMISGQLGLDWKYESGSRTRVGLGAHRFINTAGRRNAFESNLLDFSAPAYLRQGNTVFDIRNDNDPTTNLYALAADYELVNLSLNHEWRLSDTNRVTLAADVVRNFGYSEAKMLARTGSVVPERSDGYHVELAFGSVKMAQAHAWRASVGYRYLERDAVLDAFTDSDFRLGGTDVKGYTLGFDYSLTPMVMGRIKYLSGSEIDGPPLGIDVLQLDITASF
jgi:polyhydroxyalkanoate synthesis regulator phasin